ncbi:MAG: metal-dependent hydrolase [Betaproteobacteria bacterium]|nr:metal-dependent hydrolase [Betaproteobacteria bacterium]
MDALTHALSGALLARATAPSKPHPGELTPNARMAAGFTAAAFPDCDFALRLVDTLTYLDWHQGITHSLVLIPAWAWLLAHLFSWVTRRRYRWRAFFGAAFLGIAIHIAGDALTAYGTMLFAPLSTQRFSLPLAFVIDPYFTGIIAGGLAAVMFRPQGRQPAVIALIVLAGYAGFQGALHHRAIGVGTAYAATHGLAGAEIHALAQPLTPFNRKIIVSHADGYHEARVNLWRIRPPPPPAPQAGALRKIAAGYQPVSTADWKRHSRFGETLSHAPLAREAWNQEAFAGFRRFAVFPAFDHIEVSGSRVCVWFVDLRFTLPALPPSFRYGVCRNGPPDGWRLAQMRGTFWID